MAPEQLEGGELSRAADLFAVAVVLWELLRVVRLFDGGGDADDHADAAARARRAVDGGVLASERARPNAARACGIRIVSSCGNQATNSKNAGEFGQISTLFGVLGHSAGAGCKALLSTRSFGMKKDRMLVSLVLALACGVMACEDSSEGEDATGGDGFTEHLNRSGDDDDDTGRARRFVDGGVADGGRARAPFPSLDGGRGRGDRDDDTDEQAEEEADSDRGDRRPMADGGRPCRRPRFPGIAAGGERPRVPGMSGDRPRAPGASSSSSDDDDEDRPRFPGVSGARRDGGVGAP